MHEERAVRKSSGGLGIGLSRVFRLVSLHGGTIKASSNGLGQGSEFVLQLPLVDRVAVSGPVTSVAPEQGTHPDRGPQYRQRGFDGDADGYVWI